MRGEYTLKNLTYGVYHRGVLLVEIVEYPWDKYLGKDISHGTGLINLWLGWHNRLMDLRSVKQDNHNPGQQANHKSN